MARVRLALVSVDRCGFNPISALALSAYGCSSKEPVAPSLADAGDTAADASLALDAHAPDSATLDAAADAAPPSSDCVAITTDAFAYGFYDKAVWYAPFTPKFPGESKDSVFISFAGGAAMPGVYTLGVGDDAPTQACKHCVNALGGPSLDKVRQWVATAGTIAVTQVDVVNQRLAGTLDAVRLEEVSIDPTTEAVTLKPGGGLPDARSRDNRRPGEVARHKVRIKEARFAHEGQLAIPEVPLPAERVESMGRGADLERPVQLRLFARGSEKRDDRVRDRED